MKKFKEWMDKRIEPDAQHAAAAALHQTDLQTKTQLAKQKAAQENQPYAVVLIDNGEKRVYRIMPERDLGDEEFEAFDGKVISIVHPDGSQE